MVSLSSSESVMQKESSFQVTLVVDVLGNVLLLKLGH